jgi:hypothetical protein
MRSARRDANREAYDVNLLFFLNEERRNRGASPFTLSDS